MAQFILNFVLVLLCLSCDASAQVSSKRLPGCGTVNIRKHYTELTANERRRYLDAVRKFRNESPRPNEFDKMVAMHNGAAAYIHGYAEFLPWHRAFLRMFEAHLQRVSGDPTISQPYWNSYTGDTSPYNHPIFSDDWFGSNGGNNINRPYIERPESGCPLVTKTIGEIGYAESETEFRCVVRNFKTSSFPVDTSVLYTMGNQTFAPFAQEIEGSPHGTPHINIGGTMESMWSPADPVFWFHHAFIDKIWADWQNYDGGARVWAYGVYPPNPNSNSQTPSGSGTLSAGLWSLNGVQAWTALSTASLCYAYKPQPNDIFVTNFPPRINASDPADIAFRAAVASAERNDFKEAIPNWKSAPVVFGASSTRRPVGEARVPSPPKPNAKTRILKDGRIRFRKALDHRVEVPDPMPQSFIEMNNLDVELIRAQEARVREHIHNLNKFNHMTKDDIAKRAREKVENEESEDELDVDADADADIDSLPDLDDQSSDEGIFEA
ncbi:Di-copper centre-containing protein [Ramicandelaber brevisporus]|nr:Di-copper centre-containing protein [Ramicandelaber brevisporus]KAI8867225.1 Di-copper centre-containing protein [Ramicandelaber brevisporus]